MPETPLQKADRILSADDWSSLEEQVKAQGEALKAMYQALREMARAIDDQFQRLDGTAVPGSRGRYRL